MEVEEFRLEPIKHYSDSCSSDRVTLFISHSPNERGDAGRIDWNWTSAGLSMAATYPFTPHVEPTAIGCEP